MRYFREKMALSEKSLSFLVYLAIFLKIYTTSNFLVFKKIKEWIIRLSVKYHFIRTSKSEVSSFLKSHESSISPLNHFATPCIRVFSNFSGDDQQSATICILDTWILLSLKKPNVVMS